MSHVPQGMNFQNLNDFMSSFIQEDGSMGTNFHNFFTNDHIFGSPSPDFLGEEQALLNQASKIKVENHYNSHTTINNFDINAQKYFNISQENYNIGKEEKPKPKPQDKPDQLPEQTAENITKNINDPEIAKILQILAQNKNNVNNYINKNYFVVINQCPP